MTDSAIIADADLTIRTGTAEGHLGGSGSRLTFTASNLSPFLGSTPAIDRADVRTVLRHLAASGVSIGVVEGDQTVLEVGDVESSLLARAIGFRNVRVRKPFRLLARYIKR